MRSFLLILLVISLSNSEKSNESSQVEFYKEMDELSQSIEDLDHEIRNAISGGLGKKVVDSLKNQQEHFRATYYMIASQTKDLDSGPWGMWKSLKGWLLAGLVFILVFVVGIYTRARRNHSDYLMFKSKIDSGTAKLPVTQPSEKQVGSLSEIREQQMNQQESRPFMVGDIQDNPSRENESQEYEEESVKELPELDPQPIQQPIHQQINENISKEPASETELETESMDHDSRKFDVLRLAKRGATASEISRRLRVSQAEVEIIIRNNLEKKL